MYNFIFFGNSNSVCFIWITRLRGVDEHVAEVYCRLAEGLTGPRGGVTTSLVPHKHLKLLTIFPILRKITNSDSLSHADKITDDSTHSTFHLWKPKVQRERPLIAILFNLFLLRKSCSYIKVSRRSILQQRESVQVSSQVVNRYFYSHVVSSWSTNQTYFNIAKRMRRNQTHPQNKGSKLK